MKPSRNHFALVLLACATAYPSLTTRAQPATAPAANLAPVATPSTSYVSGHETLPAVNDGHDPRTSGDYRHGAYGNWPEHGTQWVQYVWPAPISTNRIDVYWWDDHKGVRLPRSSRLLYYDGTTFVPVPGTQGLGVDPNHYNATTFPELTTRKLRLEFDSSATDSTGILEWKVYDSGHSPAFPPILKAGPDRVVVLPGPTYLSATAKSVQSDTAPQLTWTKRSGPGEVTFAEEHALTTTATFSAPGDYTLRLQAGAGDLSSSDTLHVHAITTQVQPRLEPVIARDWQIDSPLWTPRLNVLITHWIPHCIDYLEHPDKHPNVNAMSRYLAGHGKTRDELRALTPAEIGQAYAAANGPPIQAFGAGGIDNFIEAGKKLKGQPARRHQGPPWANAYVYNTIESMCDALMLDPNGDAGIAKAQSAFRSKLDEWIPLILAAQEPDGYLQTRFTLDPNNPTHWSARTRGEHEGYVAGYLIEAAIAHYHATSGKDLRLYDAAKKLADCWDAHVGPPPKQTWYDGHEEIELALVRLGRLVNQIEGPDKGDRYIKLAKFLVDARHGGSDYDQSHLPPTQQYEARGHAVRAEYLYSALADLAAETKDIDYQSAAQSIWSNLVNRKYYVIGGVGSGDTAEGFGRDFALKNAAYCESCANCGQIFFQSRMLAAYHDARYADLYEDTLFNAVLSDYDLPGDNFTYTNSLDTDQKRYPWHDCPCCVGNFPRTLLSLPTWMYARLDDDLYVNLYAGSTVSIDNLAGTTVQMAQATDYPWAGHVTITVNPATPKPFTIHLREPNRDVSTLYTTTPQSNGLTSVKINGETTSPQVTNGYAMIARTWSPGDQIDLEIPMTVQRIKADPRVVADTNRVALRYGPLVFNIESVDCDVDSILPDTAPLTAEFNPTLLGGVMTIKGTFANGKPLLAIPNYARNNRGGRSIVWIKDK